MPTNDSTNQDSFALPSSQTPEEVTEMIQAMRSHLVPGAPAIPYDVPLPAVVKMGEAPDLAVEQYRHRATIAQKQCQADLDDKNAANAHERAMEMKRLERMPVGSMDEAVLKTLGDAALGAALTHARKCLDTAYWPLYEPLFVAIQEEKRRRETAGGARKPRR